MEDIKNLIAATSKYLGLANPSVVEKDKLLDLGDPCVSTSGIDIKTGGC